MDRRDPQGIRPATSNEFPLLRQIEFRADTMFEEVGIGPFTNDEAENHLDGAAVVLVAGDPAVGFASVDLVDRLPHLWQLAVLPSEGRQGRGRALVAGVCDWARSHDHAAVTLTTYRDVPWNGPFYESLGFSVVPDHELTPGLLAIRAHERAIGDDEFGVRVVMRRVL